MQIEKRKYLRYKIISDLIFEIRKKKIKVVSYNISQKGISFISHENFYIGDQGLISFKKEQISFREKGVILWVTILEENPKMKKYGLEFEKGLSIIELTGIIKKLK